MAGRLASQMSPTKLRMARLKASLSQLQIANEIGVPVSTYCAIEKGHRSVAGETALKIAALVRLKVPALFKGNGKKRYKVY